MPTHHKCPGFSETGVRDLLKSLSRFTEIRNQTALTEAVGGESGRLRVILNPLVGARYAVEAEEGRWLLARDPDRTRLFDLWRTLDQHAGAPAAEMLGDTAWARRLHELLDEVEAHSCGVMEVSLRELLSPPPAAGRGAAHLRPVE